MQTTRSLLALALLFAACSSPAPLTAPEGLSYPGAPFTFSVGVATDAKLPAFTGGGTPAEFTISKALPDGLGIDGHTGAISGTPTAEAANSSYVVVASNVAGTAAVTLELRVIDNSEPPSMLEYPMADAAYVLNMPIAANTPTVQGTMPMTFTISPDLPAGLSLDGATGAISGTPTATLASTEFVVTATNSKGSATASVHIAVVTMLVAPTLTGYSAATVAYVVNTAIPPNVPQVGGTAPFTFTVMPALPAGLSLSATTGKITGTPTAVSAAQGYVVTATNPAGSSNFTVTIRVISTATFAYPSTHFQFVTPGTAIVPIAPSMLPAGSGALTVSPALPTGMLLDATTGEVHGAPSRASAMTESTFVVSATDSTSHEVTSASFTLELVDPVIPGQAAGVRQSNAGGPMGPTGTAGVVTNGVLIDVIDSFDGTACRTGGASLTPSSGAIEVGQSISFRLAVTPFHSWTNSIEQQQAAPTNRWPAAPCMLLGTMGSTCTIGVNHGGVTYQYANLHSAFECPDPGSVTVN